MSWRMFDFRCEAGHEFEDLAQSGTQVVPCSICAKPARLVWKAAAPAVRSGSASAAEKKAIHMQFGVEVESRADINRVLRERGHTAVSAREFDDMLDKTKNEQETPPETTAAEREVARATLVPKIQAARARLQTAYANGEMDNLVRSPAAMPADVKAVIPDAAAAALGI